MLIKNLKMRNIIDKKISFLISLILAIILVLQFTLPIANSALVPFDLDNSESSIKVLEHESQVFEVDPKLACIDCDKDSILLERSLKVYEVEAGNGNARYISLITLNVKNTGRKDISDFSVIEYIPEDITTKVDEITFTIRPTRIEENSKSIVVTWMFDYLGAGEEKSAGYMINKNLSQDIISDYLPDGKVASYVKSLDGHISLNKTEEIEFPRPNLFKYLLIIIAVLIGAFLAYLAFRALHRRVKRKHLTAREREEKLLKMKENFEKMGVKVKGITIINPKAGTFKTIEKKDFANKKDMINELKKVYES